MLRDAVALPAARDRDASLEVMGGEAGLLVGPKRVVIESTQALLVMADTVGSEPALVTDAFIALAVSMREAFSVAQLPLRAVGHGEPEFTVAHAFAVAAAVTQFAIAIVGTAIVSTVDTRVSTDALAGQMRGVGRPTNAVARARLGAGAHTTRIPSPSRFAETVRWKSIFVKR